MEQLSAMAPEGQRSAHPTGPEKLLQEGVLEHPLGSLSLKIRVSMGGSSSCASCSL